MKIKNIALGVSVVSFVIGFSDLHESIFFWMGRPIGAIAFIVFLIFALLETETTVLDEERRRKAAEFKRLQRLPSVKRASNKETCAPALTTAITT